MALIRLRRKVRLIPGLVSPICLPTSANFPDANLDTVYVAGWGLISPKNCFTGEGGPVEHKKWVLGLY